MSTPMDRDGLIAALTDFQFQRFVTARLVPVLYVLGLAIGAVFAAGYLLTALRLGALVALVSLFMVPLAFLVFALYLRVLLEMVMVLFRIERNTRREGSEPL